MREIKEVKAQEAFPLIKEILENRVSVRIAVRGSSMYPFLRDSIDCVELSPADFKSIVPGDIVMIEAKGNKYIMHRVIKKKRDCFYIIGDAQQNIEGPIYEDELFAVATAVWRRDRRIECGNRWWRLLSSLWLMLRPIRHAVLKGYSHLRQVVKVL